MAYAAYGRLGDANDNHRREPSQTTIIIVALATERGEARARLATTSATKPAANAPAAATSAAQRAVASRPPPGATAAASPPACRHGLR
eukprot:CAMPEP_0185500226 /NCGR_PEP_ID=MMETSP1366-20130426/23656_1 /TAXON_ID=38817 /ORGANISM="Gephyrocapsa oceanica, Strain RCC1303" /LENGTH=87 /DNA_ID=CAMNT_0028109529 /DNA_START=347 /DNA_END=609 /DNA_ORIENTATION=-